MLRAVSLQTKMDSQIFINSTPPLALRLNMSLPLFLCPCCFQWAINLWVGVQKLLQPIFSLSMGAYLCLCVCVLMVVERSFGVIPYKYWWAVGVKRVRTAAPSPPFQFCRGGSWWVALRSCSEYLACAIMVFGNPWTTISTEDCQTSQQCPGAIPLRNTVYKKSFYGNWVAELWVNSGIERHQMGLLIERVVIN